MRKQDAFLDELRRDYDDFARISLLGLGELITALNADAVDEILRQKNDAFGKPDIPERLHAKPFGNGIILSDGETWQKTVVFSTRRSI